MADFVVVPAKRTERITYAVRDVILVANKAKAAGKDMIFLNIGDPDKFDFDVPVHLVEAVYKAMKDDKNSYSDSAGVPEALEAIRNEAERKGIKSVLDAFTAYGASEAIEICLSALVDSGDNIILPSPGYPLYSALNSKLDIESRFYKLDEKRNWQPDIEDILKKINDKTRGIVLINPNNPTGSLYSKDILIEILEIARKNNLVIFSDEIYDKILFDGKEHISIASLADDVPIVTFGGLSKCYLAPGWRVGWAIISGPNNTLKPYIEAVHKMTRARLCINHPMQYAIKPALEGPQDHIKNFIEKVQKRRDISFEKINNVDGLSCVKPEGAFYAFPKIEFDMDDKKFTEELILNTGVVVVNGSGFGEDAGKGHFRIVFLPYEEILSDAYDRIADFVKKCKNV